MTTIHKTIFSLLLMAVIFTGCKKDPEPTPATTTTGSSTGSLKIHFEGMVDTNALVLNTQNYVNANGDTFKVSTFKYYISNIALIKSDSSVLVLPVSHHLIDHSLSTTDITLSNIPVGNYKGLRFMIGVDSTNNVSGAQAGDLDPGKGMFWSWTSGYIMAKLEGTSPQSTATGNTIMFHTGGFSGANSVLRTAQPSFGTSTANVSASVTPEIHIAANVAEWFVNPNLIKFGITNVVHMPGATAKSIADNYVDMFSVEHIHN